ncbi:MAG TPA: protein kinase [Ktedonobacteraceae bacterium]|nr:protein kinase [Ktedonobacteraceae bacterium]
MRDRVGQQLGNYQLIRLLGQGSLASVYLGEHLHLRTLAALKVPFGPWADSEVESFFSEATILARLRHPHIVRVLDFGVQEGTPFLVMEYAPGGTLRQFHPRGERLSLQTIVFYVKQVASALQYIHEQRLIHRDLKPENLLLGPEKQIWLSDFGLALVTQSAQAHSFQQTAGTLAYMAPEQLAGHPISASDQYALGVLVYEWLAGERPFSGPVAELAFKQTLAPPPALSERVPTLPAVVEQVVLQALAKDPQLRFPNVQAFVQAFEEACAQDASRQTLMVPTSDLPVASPPLKTLDNRFHNLPVQPTLLIGRKQEVAAVRRLLLTEEVRLLTLTGPGGVGKTRLALQVAAECADSFADGVFFVNLAEVGDPTLVLSTIAQTLGIQEVAGQPLPERLDEHLQQKQVLLLLDNFEQVVSGAVQVADLLATCQQIKVLVTSRAVLHVRAEHEFAVLPLALPDPAHLPDLAALPHCAAVALFLERARATQSDFQLTAANAHAIAEVCVQLDGLPLAIELAAARIKLLPPQALLSRLSARLAVLTGGARDVPARQQTLRSTIVWSYQLLDAAEQRLLCCLAVFSGGCTLSAVETVCGAGSEAAGEALSVLDCAASLIDKSLLRQSEQEREEPRLVMLETIREYAREVLITSDEEETIRSAHAAYYLRLSEEAEPGLAGAERGRWLACLQQEKENLRAALAWLVQHGEQEAALRLGGALWRFWWLRGHLSEGRAQLARALAEGRGVVATSVRAKALCAAGALAGVQGDFEQAVTLCGESRVLFQALSDRRGSATALSMLGYVDLQRSDYAEARSLLEEAVTLYREVDDQDGIVWVLVNLAGVFHFQGDYERAHIVLEEAVALSRAGGDSWSIVNSLWLLALVLSFQDDLERARALLEESLALSRRESYKGGIASSLFVLGLIQLQGDVAQARVLLEESLALFKELGDRQSVAQSLGSLAWISFVQGEYAEARAFLLESFAVARAVGSKWYIAACLVGLGVVVAAQGEWTWAVRLLSAGEAECEVAHSVLPPFVRAGQERAIAAAQDQLGEEVFAAVWAEGQALSPEQALAAQGPATPPPTTPARPSSTLHALKPPTFPGGLTAREVEVLQLVAQGLTDAEVAGRLIISPRTVNTHLKSIYGKIQVKSRSAATRYAIEHQIV